MRGAVVWALLLWPVLAASAAAEGPSRLYVLAIGYNGLPAGGADSGLRELRYADDDAAAFARLGDDLGARVTVLSSFDAETARRFPALSGRLRPPLMAELQRSVRELNDAFARDRRASIEPVVLFTYSGHGVGDDGAPPALTLADGQLTQQSLYTEVLSALDARFVHVVVDACHAAAVVRPRDAQAETVVLGPDEIHAHWSRATLDGLANVGALIATSASNQAHEWDNWRQGVFTHEVLSGLRGAADVNRDRRIEYSEMAAFLSAANSGVQDVAARVQALVKAPRAAPRAAIVELNATARSAFLEGHPAAFGGLWVEAEGGQRIADLHSEQTHHVRLLVPSAHRLFVRNERGEAMVRVRPGQSLALDDLRLRARGFRVRGAVDLSLQRGLFAAAFGPAYYRGFVDSADQWIPVPLATVSGTPEMTALDGGEPSFRVLAWTGLGVSGALLATSATFGIMALNARTDFDDAEGLERKSFEAVDRYDTYGAIALGAVVTGVLTGVGSYLLLTAD
jgi:hypothetical protein